MGSVSLRSRVAGQRALGLHLLGLLSCHSLSSSSLAHAAEQTAVDLSFSGTYGCNDESALQRQVERRSETVHWVTADSGAARFDVHIRAENSRFEASVVARKPGAPEFVRSIGASSCQEVIEAVSLIIAITLPSREPPASKTSSEPALEKPTVLSGIQQRGFHWELGGGTTGVFIIGIAPSPLFGSEFFADASTRENGWSPALRLGIRHVARNAIPISVGDASAGFQMLAAFAAACPVAWLPKESFTLRWCAIGSYGDLQANSSSSSETRSVNHPWASIGSGLRVEAHLLPTLSLELDGAGEVSLFSSRFWFSGVKFHESSRFGGRLGLGVVARIP